METKTLTHLKTLEEELEKTIASGKYTKEESDILKPIFDKLINIRIIGYRLCARLSPAAKTISSIYRRAVEQQKQVDANKLQKEKDLEAKQVFDDFFSAAKEGLDATETSSLQTPLALLARENVQQQISIIKYVIEEMQLRVLDLKKSLQTVDVDYQLVIQLSSALVNALDALRDAL